MVVEITSPAVSDSIAALRAIDPGNPQLAVLAHAVAPEPVSERRSYLCRMLTGGLPVPEPVATWLRTDADAEVRAIAWMHTDPTLAQTRAHLGRDAGGKLVERAERVRAAAASHPGLEVAERRAAVSVRSAAQLRFMLTHPDRFGYPFVLSALRHSWARTGALPETLHKPVATAFAGHRDLALLVLEAEDTPPEVAAHAAASLEVTEMATWLDKLAPAYLAGHVHLDEARSTFLFSAFWGLRNSPLLVPEHAEPLARFGLSVGGGPGWFVDHVVKAARTDPVQRATALRNYNDIADFLSGLVDVETRKRVALAVLFAQRDDLTYPPSLMDLIAGAVTAQEVLAHAGTLRARNPAKWMVRYPAVLERYAPRNLAFVLRWPEMRTDEPELVAVRARLLKTFFDKHGRHLNAGTRRQLMDAVSNGWFTPAEVAALPLALVLECLHEWASFLDKKPEAFTEVIAALTSVCAPTSEETRVRVQALLALAGRDGSVCDLAEVALVALEGAAS